MIAKASFPGRRFTDRQVDCEPPDSAQRGRSQPDAVESRHDLFRVAQKPDRPRANVLVAMAEKFLGE